MPETVDTKKDADMQLRRRGERIRELEAENQALAALVDMTKAKLIALVDDVQTRIHNLVLQREAAAAKNGKKT